MLIKSAIIVNELILSTQFGAVSTWVRSYALSSCVLQLAVQSDAGGSSKGHAGPACTMSLFLEIPGDPPAARPVWNTMFRDQHDGIWSWQHTWNEKGDYFTTLLRIRGLKICLSLCPRYDLTLKDVMDNLQVSFAPRVSKIFARTIFHREPQRQGESCLQFSLRLRVMTDKCGYIDGLRTSCYMTG